MSYRDSQNEYLRKVCFDTMNPANDTVSWPRVPCTAPLPYRMVTNSLPDDSKEDDLVESYSGVPEGHWIHLLLASQRSDEPLSRMTLNCWALCIER